MTPHHWGDIVTFMDIKNYSIIDSDCTINAGAKVGEDKKKATGITVLGRGCNIAPGATVAAGEMISND